MADCPVHNKAFREGKQGGGYCASKLADGSWCKERPPKPSPATPAPGAVETAKALSPRNGATDRSIERQVAVKAAAEVVGACITAGLNPEHFADWAQRACALAVRLAQVIERGEYEAPKKPDAKP